MASTAASSHTSDSALTDVLDHGTLDNHHAHCPKSRRPSLRHKDRAVQSHNQAMADTYGNLMQEHDHDGPRSRHCLGSEEEDKTAEKRDSTITIPSTTKHAEKMVAPFLAKNIPQQYNPIGKQMGQDDQSDKSSTKYCYRHRPDLKCRRQVNEPSMEQLQNELGTLSQSDQQGIAHVWALFSAAPSKHRHLMLQGILAQCCFPQLSYISASVRDLIKIDFLTALPPELGFKILSYLDTTSLCKAAQVSQRWRSLADDDVVWHKMCEQHIDRKCTKCGWGLPLLERKRLRTEKRLIEMRATGAHLNQQEAAFVTPPESLINPHVHSRERDATRSHSSLVVGEKRPASLSPSDSSKRICTESSRTSKKTTEIPGLTTRPWKDVYKDRFKVGINWKHGRCSVKQFKGHTNGVMCLQFDDNILATGSYDTTIKIWDITTGKELRTLTGHTAGIRCLQFDETRLFSGSIDRTLRVWNWRTGECVRVLPHGHSGGIISLHFSGNFLASGSMDHTVRIWNLSDKSTFLLRGHTDWVNAVKIDAESRTVFSASDDCTVRMWDIDTRRCLKVFQGHVGQVQQVLPLPREFELDDEDLIGSSDGERSNSPDTPGIRHLQADVSDLTTTENLNTSFPNDPPRPDPPTYMLTGALDGTIRLWHIPSGRSIRTFFGHVEGIWALAADTLRLVSGAEDRMVKVWDPRTGHCERTFTGHAGPVTCVGLSDSRLATGSEDCEVRVYSFEPVAEDLSVNR